MLFDLKTGKRRRVVQIVFGFLAFIFFISFVGFGIGSDVSGGIFDAIGLGGSGSNDSATSTYQTQIDEAEEDLAKDPKDEKALTDLVRYRYLAGQEQLDADDSGQPILTEESRSEWSEALDAWEQLLQTDPKEVEPAIAGQMVFAYEALGDVGGAAGAQRVVAEQDPRPENLALLSYYLYSDGKVEAGKEAADEAIAKAEGSQKKLFSKELGKLDDQARQIAKAEEKAGDTPSASGEGGLSNPFGGLGSDTGSVPPAVP